MTWVQQGTRSLTEHPEAPGTPDGTLRVCLGRKVEKEEKTEIEKAWEQEREQKDGQEGKWRQEKALEVLKRK